MASVGAIDCTFVKGVGASPRERVQAWFVPGQDGKSAILLGANDGDFAFTCVLYDTASGIQGWYALLEQAQGTVVTVVDDWGFSWANCLVEEVSLRVPRPAKGGGAGIEARGEVAIRGTVVA